MALVQKALIDVSVLARLADTGVEAQMVQLGATSVSNDLSAALAEQAAERKKEVVKAAANEILNLSQNADAFLASQLAAKAALQESIDAIDKVNANVQRARQYGLEKNNFLPLAQILGLGIPAGTKKELKEVPKDWTPAAAATAA